MDSTLNKIFLTVFLEFMFFFQKKKAKKVAYTWYIRVKIQFNRDTASKNSLRNRNELEKPRAIKKYAQNSLFFRGVDLFNKLPEI